MDQITTLTNGQIIPILNEYGVCICPNVLTASESDALRDGIIAELENLTADFDPPFLYADSSTWKALESLAPSKRMIYQYPWQLAHSQCLWDVRSNPNVINKFATIWGTKNLVVSFDTIAFHLPPEITKKPFQKEKDKWWHTDQRFEKEGLHCVQGQVNGVDADVGDATLVVLIGSHLYHHEYGVVHNVQVDKDWYLFENGVGWFLRKGCQELRIVAPKGSLILWDSRTVHYGSEPLKGRANPNIRTTMYVSYSPRLHCSQEVLNRRIEFFENMVMTNHWAHDPASKPKKPRRRKIPDNVRSVKFPSLHSNFRHLVGYFEYFEYR